MLGAKPSKWCLFVCPFLFQNCYLDYSGLCFLCNLHLFSLSLSSITVKVVLFIYSMFANYLSLSLSFISCLIIRALSYRTYGHEYERTDLMRDGRTDQAVYRVFFAPDKLQKCSYWLYMDNFPHCRLIDCRKHIKRE